MILQSVIVTFQQIERVRQGNFSSKTEEALWNPFAESDEEKSKKYS